MQLPVLQGQQKLDNTSDEQNNISESDIISENESNMSENYKAQSELSDSGVDRLVREVALQILKSQ